MAEGDNGHSAARKDMTGVLHELPPLRDVERFVAFLLLKSGKSFAEQRRWDHHFSGGTAGPHHDHDGQHRCKSNCHRSYPVNRQRICCLRQLVCQELQDNSECFAGCAGRLEAACRTCQTSPATGSVCRIVSPHSTVNKFAAEWQFKTFALIALGVLIMRCFMVLDSGCIVRPVRKVQRRSSGQATGLSNGAIPSLCQKCASGFLKEIVTLWTEARRPPTLWSWGQALTWRSC